jgi:hypothetical protein
VAGAVATGSAANAAACAAATAALALPDLPNALARIAAIVAPGVGHSRKSFWKKPWDGRLSPRATNACAIDANSICRAISLMRRSSS